jgi:hypothetical protein
MSVTRLIAGGGVRAQPKKARTNGGRGGLGHRHKEPSPHVRVTRLRVTGEGSMMFVIVAAASILVAVWYVMLMNRIMTKR